MWVKYSLIYLKLEKCPITYEDEKSLTLLIYGNPKAAGPQYICSKKVNGSCKDAEHRNITKDIIPNKG